MHCAPVVLLCCVLLLKGSSGDNAMPCHGTFEISGKEKTSSDEMFVKPKSILRLNFTISDPSIRKELAHGKVLVGNSTICTFHQPDGHCFAPVYPNCTCHSWTLSVWRWVENPSKENWTFVANSNTSRWKQIIVMKEYRYGDFEISGKESFVETCSDEMFVKPRSILRLDLTISDTSIRKELTPVLVMLGNATMFHQPDGHCFKPVYPNCTCDSWTLSVWGWVENPSKENWTFVGDSDNSKQDPVITNFTQIPSPVADNSTVEVTCAWKEGSIPCNATLRRNGIPQDDVTYDFNDEVRQARHNVSDLQCGVNDVISCHVGEKERNMTLPVRCVPLFGDVHGPFYANSSQPLLKFPVQTFYDITGCWLRSRHTTPEETTNGTVEDTSCDSHMNLTGEFPDQTVTLALSNVTHYGPWRLELHNEIGSGFVDFTVERSPEQKTDDSNTGTSNIIYVGVAVVAVVIVVAPVIAVLLSCRRHKTNRDKRRRSKDRGGVTRRQKNRETWNMPDVPPPYYRGSNVSITITNDIYEGTPDILAYSEVQDTTLPKQGSVIGKYERGRPAQCTSGDYEDVDLNMQQQAQLGI